MGEQTPPWLALTDLLATIAEGLSYQAECRPRPSRSREALRAAVADLHDAIRHIRVEDGADQDSPRVC